MSHEKKHMIGMGSRVVKTGGRHSMSFVGHRIPGTGQQTPCGV